MHKTVKACSMAHALFRITVVQSFLAFYMAHDFSIVRFLSHVVMCVSRGVSIWFLEQKTVKFDINEPLMQEHFEYVEFLYKK